MRCVAVRRGNIPQSDRDRSGAFEAVSPAVAAVVSSVIVAIVTFLTRTTEITSPTQRLFPAIPPSGAILSHRNTILLLIATKTILRQI